MALAPPGRSRRVPAPARVAVLTAVLAAAGAVAFLQPRAPALMAAPQVAWWVLAAVFAVTEACVVRLRLRREAFHLSLSEVPLVLGLFLADPHDLLLGRVAGSAAVFVLHRRQPPLKAAFNTALVAAGTSVAVAVFSLVLGGRDPLGTAGWTAGVTAACTGGLLDACALLLVVRWYRGGVGPRESLHEIATSLAGPALVGLAGVAAALAALRDARGVLPLAVAAAVALLGYRAFATLSDRHSSLERLYVLSDALAAAPASADVIASVLGQSLDMLRARYAEVLLAGVAAAPRSWSLAAGGEAAGPAAGSLPAPPRTGLLRGAEAAERVFLDTRGVREAVVVPLRVDDGASGFLLVADPGEARGFPEGDVRLLEMVANHAGVALRNGRLMERLHAEARHDELTGLPNRLSFKELLEAAADERVPCAVMVLDFDGFKAVNDTLGHQAGDDLLRVLAGRLAATAAGEAVVARLGGDEFAVLMTGCTGSEAAVGLAGRLLGVFDEPVAVAGTRLRLGGSLGIALAPEHGVTASDLLRNADIAMYAAKSAAGGARLFCADLVETTTAALTLATDLRDAVRDGAIDIAVQPLVDLASGAVHSVEVLARWRHPELGEVSPRAFFDAAERSGQVPTLSALVLDRALALARRCCDDGRPLRVAVNLAPRWLADSTLPDQVAAALERAGVAADLLCLEITESGVIADPGRTIGTLTRLRDMGVHLSVDDFGTGYSSLTYLSRLPVDQLKVDAAFVQRLGESPSDLAIVRSIVDLGRNLGLQVVAEGVTGEEGRRMLAEMGCALGQGYLFARPLEPAALPAFLALADARTVGEVPVPRVPPGPRRPGDDVPVPATASPVVPSGLPRERRRHRGVPPRV